MPVTCIRIFNQIIVKKFFSNTNIKILTRSAKYLFEVNRYTIINALRAKHKVDKNIIIIEIFSTENPNLKKISEN